MKRLSKLKIFHFDSLKNRSLTSLKILALVLLTSVSSASFAANEQERHIHVNGEHLDAQNIALLDQLAQVKVEDGYYWINMNTGEWGYENNAQVQGVLQTIVNYNNQLQAQQSGMGNGNNGNSGFSDADRYNDWEGVSGTGSVTSGNLNGQNCTFVSVGGTTMKSCD